jgi:hypothetical protein
MLQLRNETELPVALFALPDPDGVETLHVVVQQTFSLVPDAPATPQRPIARADVRVGEGPAAWLQRPSVVHIAKPWSEVLVEGEAVVPHGEAVPSLDVEIVVGSLRRVVRVLGDRWFTGHSAPFATGPASFQRMPLTPTRAFGGPGEVRNPAGMGFVASGVDTASLRGLPLPNLEDPFALFTGPGDAPEPALLSPLDASWQPRLGYAGTYDDTWDRTRAPFLPTDFDTRFAQVAPRTMWIEPGLRGGEAITLVHLSDTPRIDSRVPARPLAVHAWYRGETVALPVRIETLHLFPGEGVGTVVYRATLRCGHRLLDVAEVAVGWGEAP